MKDDPDLGELSNRRSILYSLEKALEVSENRLKLEAVRNENHDNRARIANRDIYRLYKAVTDRLDVEPRVVYTGGELLEREEAEERMEKQNLELEELEPSL